MSKWICQILIMIFSKITVYPSMIQAQTDKPLFLASAKVERECQWRYSLSTFGDRACIIIRLWTVPPVSIIGWQTQTFQLAHPMTDYCNVCCNDIDQHQCKKATLKRRMRWSVTFCWFETNAHSVAIVCQNSMDSSLYVSPPIAGANLNSVSWFQLPSGS